MLLRAFVSVIEHIRSNKEGYERFLWVRFAFRLVIPQENVWK